jgi:hypothetical protein
MKPEYKLEQLSYPQVSSDGTYGTHVSVDCCDPLIGSSLQQLACDDLLNCEHNTIFASNSNRRSTILNCLYCVFDLEVSAIGRED